MTSTRLPGKVLADLGGEPTLAFMIRRLKLSRGIDDIVVATTTNAADDPVVELAQKMSVGVWRGSENDVLQRVLDAARNHDADVIVELTGDCPLVDPAIVSNVIEQYHAARVDYVSNILVRTYPIGMDTQVFATSVLADVARRTSDAADHEHVSLYIYRHPEIYSLLNVPAPQHETWPDLRLTLDTIEDLQVIRAVHAALRHHGVGFTLNQILQFLHQHREVVAINASVQKKHV